MDYAIYQEVRRAVDTLDKSSKAFCKLVDKICDLIDREEEKNR